MINICTRSKSTCTFALSLSILFAFRFALCVSVVIKNQMYVFASKFKIDKDEFVSPHLELGGPFSHHKRAVLFNQER